MRWAADLEDDAVAAVSPDDVLDGEHLERARLGLPREPPRTHTPSASSAADDDDDDDDDRAPRPDGRDGVESAKLLAAGGIAGAVSKTATAPLARLTILYQVQGVATAAPVGGGAAAPPPPSPIAGLSLRAALRSVAAREGVASLWRGNAVTIIHRLPYSAVNFWAYERLTEAWLAAAGDGDDGGDGGWLASARADTVRRLACGGAAGMAACALAYPLDLVRTRLAASGAAAGETRPSVGATLAAIVRREGARGLYRGLGATLAQVGPSLALNYTGERERERGREEGGGGGGTPITTRTPSIPPTPTPHLHPFFQPTAPSAPPGWRAPPRAPPPPPPPPSRAARSRASSPPPPPSPSTSSAAACSWRPRRTRGGAPPRTRAWCGA
jgi:hypothetical protein